MGVSFVPPDESEPVPTPGFEGFEKRLEVEFWDPLGFASTEGLREIPRAELETMLAAAECTIVASLSNEHFDSYVLSESSLFVYPSKVVLKTCGTTQLLKAIPCLLKSAGLLSMVACRCKYTRGSFLFPDAQPSPYRNFNEETMVLEKHFGHLGGGGKAYVMGDGTDTHRWHVYVAAAEVAPEDKTYTLEMCMTQLDRTAASLFDRALHYRSAGDMTLLSGIRSLLPHSAISDFAFDPCGYSMNSLEDSAHSTIHVTPEDGFSYASFETMGYDPTTVDLGSLVDKVLGCFKPGVFSISLSASGHCHSQSAGSWGIPVSPRGYVCSGTTRHEMPGGSFIVYHTYTKNLVGEVPVMPLALFPALEKAAANGHRKEVSSKSFLHGVQHVSEKTGLHKGAEVIGPTVKDIDSFIRRKILSSGREDAFYVLDLAVVMRLWKIWQSAMPRVHPFYAVKCNPEPQLLSLLATLGAGFDIASKAELEAVSKLGVSPRNMVFANPCKLPSHITEAADAGVVYTTFDSESELYKLKKYHPNAEALLRFRADDTGARCPLGVKYGAELGECMHLLETAKKLGLHVAGVAFHVGSGASDGRAFAMGIKSARKMFDIADALGLPKFTMLDIGGGFVSDGGTGVTFSSAAYEINKALEEHFPKDMHTEVKIIAEPGRFFAEEAFSLATLVFGSRFRNNEGRKTAEYWINDGLYGSMNCLLYDHATLSVRALQFAMPGGSSSGDDSESSDDEALLDAELHPSTIFGPTCDGLDTILRDVWLPQLECGDWLVFPRMGAYTKSAGSAFNGFPVPDTTFYVHSGAVKS